jgi:small GTP-binding protein
VELVLVGRSNVGKSLLIRRLTGLRVRVGKRPGVTRRIARYRLNGLEVVDLPGFGFMSRIPRRVQERAKTAIVRYLERHREQIIVAIEVVDARAFLEIAERWARRGQIPVDVEFFRFLRELGLEPIVAVNKIDLIYLNERDEILDAICERLGLLPPWRQWLDTIVPLSARTGEGLKHLRELIDKRLRRKHLERLIRFIKG